MLRVYTAHARGFVMNAFDSDFWRGQRFFQQREVVSQRVCYFLRLPVAGRSSFFTCLCIILLSLMCRRPFKYQKFVFCIQTVMLKYALVS